MSDIFLLFFDPARPLAFGVNTLITVLTAFALSDLLRRYIVLGIERKALLAGKEALKPVGSLLEARGSRSERSTIESAAQNLPAKALISERFEDLLAIGPTDHVDMEGLSTLTSEEVARRLAFPRGLGPSLVLLGLLGTLWGLATAVTDLSTIIGTGDFSTSTLREAIAGTLGGMKTAFSTTLAGVAGTVLVRAATGFVASRYQDFSVDLERLLVTRVVPAFEVSERTALPQAAQALTQLQEDIDGNMKALVAAMVQQGNSLNDQLQARFDQIEDAFNRRAQELLQETGRAMSAVMSMLGEKEPDAPSLAEYVETVRLVTVGLERSVDSASSMIPELRESLGSTIQEHHNSLSEALQAYAGRVEPILEKQHEAATRLVAAASGSADSVAALEVQLSELNKSFCLARQSWEQLDGLIEQLGESTRQALAEGLRSVVEELKAERRLSGEERQRMGAALEAFQASLKETLDRLHEDRTAAQQRAEELLSTLRTILTEGLNRIVESNEAGREEQAGEFTKAIREMTHEIRDLSRTAVRPARQPTRVTRGGQWEWGRQSDGASPGSSPQPGEGS